MGHQEQHLEFIDAAAAHMSAYDNNPRAQAWAILWMDGADLRTRDEEELATLSSKCLTTGPVVALGSFGHLGNRVQLDARVEMLRGNAVEMQGCIDTLQVESPAKPRLYRARVDDQVVIKLCRTTSRRDELCFGMTATCLL